MESTIKDLLERRSCRSYSDKQITDAELNTVLEAGLIAPSAMNRQSPAARQQHRSAEDDGEEAEHHQADGSGKMLPYLFEKGFQSFHITKQ